MYKSHLNSHSCCCRPRQDAQHTRSALTVPTAESPKCFGCRAVNGCLPALHRQAPVFRGSCHGCKCVPLLQPPAAATHCRQCQNCCHSRYCCCSCFSSRHCRCGDHTWPLPLPPLPRQPWLLLQGASLRCCCCCCFRARHCPCCSDRHRRSPPSATPAGCCPLPRWR